MSQPLSSTTPGGAPRPPSRKDSAPRPPSRERGAAREALLLAARSEFDEVGFEGTDTNRIARRAGYAPQTFYRHFADKTAIFVATYHRWVADEWKDLSSADGKGAAESASILLKHHARHREFRRSLRRLTTIDPVVKAARAVSRRQQLDRLDAGDAARGRQARGDKRLALLLCIERIADAAADGELDDLGLTGKEQQEMLADVIRRLARPS